MPITRVTQSILHSSTANMVQRQQRRLLDAQLTVATQKRIRTLSDDPTGAGQVLNLRTQLAQTQQFLRNVDRATSLANAYDTALSQADSLLARARELVVKELNTAATSDTTREVTAVEIIGLREQLIQIANTRVGSQFIFAGHASDAPPFSSVVPSAAAGGGNTGTGVVSQIAVSDVSRVTGHQYQIVFTSPASFDVLDVTQGTTLSAGNAFTPGANITVAGITLQVTGAPAAGDTFDITSTAAGAYAGDGGEIRLEIEDGVLTPINLTGAQTFLGAGLPGGLDIMDLLNDVVEALRGGDEATLAASLDRFDAAQRQIVGQQAVIGGRQNLLDSTVARLEDAALSTKNLISSIEDVDLAEAISEFTRVESAYQASLGAAARVIQPSLLDFLR